MANCIFIADALLEPPLSLFFLTEIKGGEIHLCREVLVQACK